MNNVWIRIGWNGHSQSENELSQLLCFLHFRSYEYESSLSLLQERVREYEVSQMALDSIKTGESPVTNGD